MAWAAGKITNIAFNAGSGLPIFNVKSPPYNATGNGIADDRAAIQNALDAAQLVNGTVFIPVGTYKISSALTVTKPITIQGEYIGYGRRQSNNNWDCFGSVIWNASTTGNAITYTPSEVGNHTGSGLIIRDIGISTPPPSTAYAYNSWDAPGWGPFSTGTGIFLGQYAYGCKIYNCWVTRHYTGIDLNNGSTTLTENAFNEIHDSFVAICKNTGINASGIEQRVVNCQVKCNDPEWVSGDANPAQGTYGIVANGNGSWISRNLVICYAYGYYSAGLGYGQQFVDNFADSCKYPYWVKNAGYSQLVGCQGTACYFNPTTGLYPTAEAGITVGPKSVVQGCSIYRGRVGVSIEGANCTVSGCNFISTNGNADGVSSNGIQIATTGTVLINGNLSGGLLFATAGSSSCVVTGNDLSAGIGGTQGATIFRGNIGKTDAG